MIRWRLLGIVLSFLGLATAVGHWAMPTLAPVDRLAANMSAYVKERPDDANGYYVLGRIHGLAFTRKTKQIAVWDREGAAGQMPQIAEDMHQFWGERSGKDHPEQAPSADELARHLEGAVKNYERAIELAPAQGHYHLGLAYVLETGGVFADRVSVAPGAKEPDKARAEEIERLVGDLANDKESVRKAAKEKLRAMLPEAAAILARHRQDERAAAREVVFELLKEQWRERAIAAYYAAYERCIKEALAQKQQPLAGLRVLAGYEAADGYVRMMKARGPRNEEEQKRFAAVEADLKTLNKLPPNGAITPIIFVVDAERPMESLLSAKTTTFDLDGMANGQRWPWVRPDTGFLVWDPEGNGKIESGRQLFGSVTWWMFFEDGYHALDALDDNRDGWLSGCELKGMAAWFDRNENGRSDPGEVVSLESCRIEAIAVRATSFEGASPVNRAGMLMWDGRRLPTYDWIAHPVSN